MLQIILRLVTVLLCINFGMAQDDFESKILQEEKAFFTATNDSVKARCVINKIQLFITENRVNDRLLFEVKRLENKWVLEDEKTNLYWNISVACYLLNEPYYYLNYSGRYRERSGESIELKILDFLNYVKRDKKKAAQLLDDLVQQDTTLVELSSLIDANFHESRFKVIARVSSLIVPGSGLLMVKEPLKGATSLGLNTATFFALRYLIQNSLFINSVGWGINLIQRFYLGGATLTEKMIVKKERKEKAHLTREAEDALRKVLIKYPLNFNN